MLVETYRVSLIIAVMLKRSGKVKSRISEKTLKIISGRQRIRAGFLIDLQNHLREIGIDIIELERGGFAIYKMSIFEGIPNILAKNFLPRAERLVMDNETLIKELELNDDNFDLDE